MRVQRYERPRAQDVSAEESQLSSRGTFTNKDQMWSEFSGKRQRGKLYRTQGNGKYKIWRGEKKKSLQAMKTISENVLK